MSRTQFKVRFIFIFFGMLMLSLHANAQQFDQSYVKWKTQQQAHDLKLKKNDDNNYLSKPSIATQADKKSSLDALALSDTKVHLNSANRVQLQQLNGVGEKKAQAIIDYRQQNGPFKKIDDLQKIKGIGPKMLEKIKPQLRL